MVVGVDTAIAGADTAMEVCSLVNGERVAVLPPDDFDGKAAREVKQILAAQVGMTRFCLRLVADDGHEIKNEEVFAGDTAKVSLVKVQLRQPDARQVEEMVLAAWNSDLEAIEHFLEQPLDPNVTLDNCGARDSLQIVFDDPRHAQTPLHAAAAQGHAEAARLLLDAGASLASTDDRDATPLHLAAMNGHLHTVRLLLYEGAVIDSRDEVRATPLCRAAEHGHHQVVRFLLDEGAAKDHADEVGATPLCNAAEKGFADIVGLLLDEGADKDGAVSAFVTPLIQAVGGGHIDVVALLLDARADPDHTTRQGETALYRAAAKGDLQIVRFLLESGADSELAWDDDCPFVVACKNGHMKVAELLAGFHEN